MDAEQQGPPTATVADLTAAGALRVDPPRTTGDVFVVEFERGDRLVLSPGMAAVLVSVITEFLLADRLF